MIIWKGWGILSALLAAAIVFGGILATEILKIPDNVSQYSVAFGLALGGVINWFVGRSLNQDKRDVGLSVLNRHSLLFIPMEYWSIAFVIGSIVVLSIRR